MMKTATITAGDVMTAFVTAEPTDTLGEVAEKMREANAGSALVLDYGRLDQAHALARAAYAPYEKDTKPGPFPFPSMRARYGLAEVLQAQGKAEATRLTVQAEMQALEERSKTAAAYQSHPALLRLEELAALRDMARNANARLYLDFPAPLAANGEEK